MTSVPPRPTRAAEIPVVAQEYFARTHTGGTADVSPVPRRPTGTSNVRENWFLRAPNGGTVFQRPPASSHVNRVDSRFREMPNGGGTVYEVPAGGTDEGDE